jgi:hypothetical protein
MRHKIPVPGSGKDTHLFMETGGKKTALNLITVPRQIIIRGIYTKSNTLRAFQIRTLLPNTLIARIIPSPTGSHQQTTARRVLYVDMGHSLFRQIRHSITKPQITTAQTLLSTGLHLQIGSFTSRINTGVKVEQDNSFRTKRKWLPKRHISQSYCRIVSLL